MRLNISKEEYENKINRKNSIPFKIILFVAIFMSIFCSIVGFSLNERIIDAIGGFILGFLVTFMIGGLIITMISANMAPEAPFCIYEFFEQLNEKVINVENVGSREFLGKVQVYKASNSFVVETENSTYITAIKDNKVILSTKIEKTLN